MAHNSPAEMQPHSDVSKVSPKGKRAMFVLESYAHNRRVDVHEATTAHSEG